MTVPELLIPKMTGENIQRQKYHVGARALEILSNIMAFYFLTLHIHECLIVIDGNLLNVEMNVFLMKTVEVVLSVLKMIFPLSGWEGK